jgi:hypothetical protein
MNRRASTLVLVAEELAETRDDDTRVDAELEALGALGQLGLAAECEPAVAADMLADVSPAARARLRSLCARALDLDLADLEQALAAVGRADEALLTEPVLAPDPNAAQVLQGRVLEALHARERIARLSSAARALQAAVEDVELRLPAIDARLRELLPRLAFLAPPISELRLELPEPIRANRWWLRPPDEPADVLGAAPELATWVAERRAADGRLRLTTEEARALLATEAGRRLATYLADDLDLTAAQPTTAEAEATLGDLSIEAALERAYGPGGPAWARRKAPSLASRIEHAFRDTWRRALDWMRELAPRPEPVLSTSSVPRADRDSLALPRSVLAHGWIAPQELVAEQAWLISGGLLASGAHASGFPAVLFVPATDVRRLQVDGAWLDRQGGGVVLRPGSSLAIERDTGVAAVDLIGSTSDEALVCILQQIRQHDIAALRELWSAVLGVAQDDEERTRLSGLREVVERVAPSR